MKSVFIYKIDNKNLNRALMEGLSNDINKAVSIYTIQICW